MADAEQGVLGLGLIGCGGFGRFCFQQYAALEGISPVGVTDLVPEAARAAARDFSVRCFGSVEELLADPKVGIVHIATPPGTHRDLALGAIRAGKHVLCEKPLATTLEDGRTMVEAAHRAQRVLVVNFIERYNPLAAAVSRIVREGLLGAPLHAFFENYAGDERLGPEHWFWDRAQSGGIFIEHGVHFFDLFEMWFGPGKVLAAQQAYRPGGGQIVDQVQCQVRYGDELLAQFYHGFHQADRMDRQELRILFERGDVKLFEWVPTRIEIDALVDRATSERLASITPNARVKDQDPCTGDQRKVGARHASYEADGRSDIRGDAGLGKQQLYQHVVRELMRDQVQYVRNRAHQRLVTEENGLSSLQIAVKADTLARA